MAEVAPEDYDKLMPFGVSEAEGHSWQETERKRTGLHLLLKETGFDHEDLKAYSEFQLTVNERCASLAEYFQNFAMILDRQLQSILTAAEGAEHVLVLNLMPLYLSTSRIDKIVDGLYTQFTSMRLFRVVVLLVRNIDWVLKSRIFQRIWQSEKFTAEMITIDIRCYGARFSPNEQIKPFDISREPIRAMLNTDYNTVYKSLIYETNSYIGHFVLESSHIRTHYDLTEYIRRDNIWEYLHEKFTQLVGEKERILILGVGMENAVIRRIGEQLKTLFGDRVLVDFFPAFEFKVTKEIPTDWPQRYDIAIVVTDIVNTGATIKPWIDELKNKGQEKSVGAFAVARMQNSHDAISGVPISTGVVIKRDFYPNDSTECSLCSIFQPAIKVKNAKDFCQVHNAQLTAYDFWELVSETKTLHRRTPDPQGRLLAYRIDTVRVFHHYGRWLGNVIKHKFAQTWANMKPDALCTVKERTGIQGGIEFARLVGNSLNVKKIIAIDRIDLPRVTPGGGLPTGCVNPFVGTEKVLVVDDGINYGHTMVQLITFCLASGHVPMGGMVFDNRLGEREIAKIRSNMGRAKLVSLYDWPASTINL